MMNNTLLKVCALALVVGAAACSPKADDDSDAPKAEEVKTKQPEERKATFDPNLKPKNIVWDDPVKQKEWEARQKKASTAQPPSAKPAQEQVRKP